MLPTSMAEHLPLQSALEMVSRCPTLTAEAVSGYCSDWEGESDLEDGSVWSGESLSSTVGWGLGAHGRPAFWGLHGLLGCAPPMMERGCE